MSLLIGLLVWEVIGWLAICFYRRKYRNKYPFLIELEESEAKEVNEFRAKLRPVFRFTLDFLFGFIELLIWPYSIFMYRRWAESRINYLDYI